MDVTATPRLAEMASADWVTRAVAAASTAAAVDAALGVAAAFPPVGLSGMARTAATWTLAGDTRRERKHAGSLQSSWLRRLVRRRARWVSSNEATSPATVSPTSTIVDGADTMA